MRVSRDEKRKNKILNQKKAEEKEQNEKEEKIQ
jgi:hypothetical protein